MRSVALAPTRLMHGGPAGGIGYDLATHEAKQQCSFSLG